MKELTWKPILSNLKEARGEIRDIHERLHFLQFGELPEKEEPSPGDARDAKYIAYLESQEKRNPFTESALFCALEHAYHHLNWAWNCRRTPEERVWHFTGSDADRWNRFPDTAAFADLWPSDRSVKGRRHHYVGVGRRKVSLQVVRIHMQMAFAKLNSLGYLVAKRAGEDWPRPKGLRPGVEDQPFTEKDFTRRMHRIYSTLNMAWNSRMDKTFVVGARAIDRRRRFSLAFATGCYNMWRRRQKLHRGVGSREDLAS